MPRGRCRINMSLSVVALLFSRGDPPRIDGARAANAKPIVERRAHLRLIRNWFAERVLSDLTGGGNQRGNFD